MRFLIFALAGCLAACGSSGGSDTTGAKQACTPGDQKACACPGSSAEGVQVCDHDGSGYGSCTGCGSGSGGAGTGGDGTSSPDAGSDTGGSVGAGGATSSGGSTGGTGAVSAGGASSTGGAATVQPPDYVNIDIVQALIGPSKSDGSYWDTTGTIPSSVSDALAAAAGQPEVGPLLDFMASSAVQSLSKPDPFGGAELDWAGTGFDPAYDIPLADTSNNTEDTFQPTFPGPPKPPGWQQVPYSDGLLVRVTLTDEDIALNDDIGTATVKHGDILAAWSAQGTYWVRVDDQTNKQLLAIAIQVTTAAPP